MRRDGFQAAYAIRHAWSGDGSLPNSTPNQPPCLNTVFQAAHVYRWISLTTIGSLKRSSA